MLRRPRERKREQPWIQKDDLIDDRPLDSEEGDEFRLRDVAVEVAELCELAVTPTTLALYGSWGSGKSSLAKLLEKRFEDNPKSAFACFNAFKYAEFPLRRHFLSQLADSFDVKGSQFREGLYESVKGLKVDISGRRWLTLLRVVGIAIAVTMTFLLAVALIAALVSWLESDASFRRTFTSAIRSSVPAMAVATPIVATVLALAGKFITAETTTNTPSSDEEFERLFKELVAKVQEEHKCERVVIFIDELDRCSDKEVVTTLETLRTFLEVSPCVFIVAADQQALERALNNAARQSTPSNPSNPYYSVGSAYLDKIFNYQLSLPPILPRRLSRFALGLISERRGVWKRVPDRPQLVSVLVPTHVRSPRRVKALLNSFALSYQLALKRSAEKTLDENLETRASELAKLVCLRIEFPIFARDLELDHRLPGLTLKFYDDPDLKEDDLRDRPEYRGVSSEALHRAHLYAHEELEVAEIIARRSPHADEAEEVEDETAEPIEDGGGQPESVKGSHARQLIRYLEKTREIANPGRDLIFLESLGAAFDLPSELAESLESNAVDGRTDEVVKAVDELEYPDQQRACRLLAHRIIESEAIGIEAQNVARSLFRAIGVMKGELAPVAQDLLNALVTYNAGYGLEEDDLHGALALALSDTGRAAKQMRGTVLSRPEAVSNDELGLFILGHSPQLKEHKGKLADVFVARLNEGLGVRCEEVTRNASDETVREWLDAADTQNEDSVEALKGFVESALDVKRDAVARYALTKLISAGNETSDEAATSLIGRFAPVTDTDVIGAIVGRARNQPVPEWPAWFGPIDEGSAKKLPERDATLDDYLHGLWQARFGAGAEGAGVSETDFEAAASELGRLFTPRVDGEGPDLLDGDGGLQSAGEATQREGKYGALCVLVDADALGDAGAAASILRDIGRILASAPGDSDPIEMSDYVLRNTIRPPGIAGDDVVASFAQAAEESPWLNTVAREVIRVRLAVAALRFPQHESVPVAESTTEALLADGSAAANGAVADWLRELQPEPMVAYRLLESRVRSGRPLDEPIRSALESASGGWSPGAKADILEKIGKEYVQGKVNDSAIKTFGLSDADPRRTGEVLVQCFEDSPSNPERERTVALWGLLSPIPDDVARTLINRIYLPLLSLGKGAVKIALSNFELVRHHPNKALKKRIKSAIIAGARGDQNLEKRAGRVLERAGWATNRSHRRRG